MPEFNRIAMACVLGVLAGMIGACKPTDLGPPASRPSSRPAATTAAPVAETPEPGSAPDGPAVIVSSRPAVVLPVLALTVEIPWDEVYPGDPLRFVARVTFPRARQEINRALRSATATAKAASRPAAAEPPRPEVPANWADRGMMLTLSRVTETGARQTLLQNVKWTEFMIGQLTSRPEPASSGSEQDLPAKLRLPPAAGPRTWGVPPTVAKLTPGHYLLEAEWNGKDRVAAELLDGGETLRTQVDFDVVPVESPDQTGAHAERLAQWQYAQGNLAEAAKLAQEAISADPLTLSPERVATYVMLAQCQASQGKQWQAASTLKQLLGLLPDGDGLAQTVKQRVDELEQKGSGK